MLTPALRVGEPDPQAPMDRTCVSTGRSPETSVPRRLNAPTPNVGDRRGGNPRHERVSFVHGYSGPQGRHAMVVAHFFESGQRRRLRWGRVESAPLMAGAVALASTGYIAAITKRPGRATSARPGVQGSPQREPALPRRQLESRVREAQGRVILLERGLDRSPVAAAGDRL